jgi:hypothetical protein
VSVDVSTLGWATVQSRTGDVEAGVAFTVRDSGSTVVLSGVTDANGQITGSLAAGQYAVTVGSVTKTVDVVDGSSAAANGSYALVYSGGAYPSRPAGLAAGRAQYIGPTQPSSWLTNDLWLKTS